MTRILLRRPALRRAVTAAATAAVVVIAQAGAAGVARADPAAPADGCDRAEVVLAWQTAGSQVQAAAQVALLGSDADVCAFLGLWEQRGAVDKRIAVNQVLASGGPATQIAAQAALDSTDGSALDTFLTSGWQGPEVTDLRVRVNQMMARGGTQLRAAAQRVLDAGDHDSLAAFVQSGWRQPYAIDQRLRVNQVMAAGGPEVRTVAQQALDAGDVTSLTRFLDVQWPLAVARDEEDAQIADLTQVAVDAAATATTETQAAQDEATRAAAAAAAAKQASEEAKADAARTQNDAAKAAAAARRAAQAAQAASAAARQAVGAAAEANAAARAAANAAGRAADVAAKLSQGASKAYQSAADARLDASGKAKALQAADELDEYLSGWRDRSGAAAIKAAQQAALDAVNAIARANGAVRDATAAAQNAQTAVDTANAVGADADEARNAAQGAAADANRAARAAAAAASYANAAANAAGDAYNAANQAVADATAAAAAARDAAAHAGEAADAAQKATAHAQAALAAANAAVTAATNAQKIYDAARTAESDQLEIAFEAKDEAAQTLRDALDAQPVTDRWDGPQGAKRSAALNQLIAEAKDPATPHAQAVSDARRVAFTLAGSDGGWTAAIARNALGGDDTVVLDYVTSGVDRAAGMDDRVSLIGLATNADGSAAFNAAANAALAGSDAQVTAFLTTRDYPGSGAEDRIAVNQVLAAAQTAGNTVTAQRAQQALDDGSEAALRSFLQTGQYAAATVDWRLKVNQILADPDSGPELRAAAQVALDGPAQFLDQFLTVDRYRAAQDDQNTAAHNNTVLSMLVQAQTAAMTATHDAYLAEEAAARARGSAAEADGYARQAADAANSAATYAQQAQQSAQAAANSANQAAASATTARNAATAANASARDAAQSANAARTHAMTAYQLAQDAIDAYNDAYNDAVEAHEAAAAALARANGALDRLSKAAAQVQKDYSDSESANRSLWQDVLSIPRGCAPLTTPSLGSGQAFSDCVSLASVNFPPGDPGAELRRALMDYELQGLGVRQTFDLRQCANCLNAVDTLLAPYLAPSQADRPSFLLEGAGLNDSGDSRLAGITDLSMLTGVQTLLTETTVNRQVMATAAERLGLHCADGSDQLPCLKIALGQPGTNLVTFASAKGLTTIGDQDQQTWNLELLRAISDPDVEINVSLQGLGGSTYQNRFLIALKGALLGPSPAPKLSGTSAEWEIRYLTQAVLSGVRSWGSIKFYGDDGALLPTWPQPDWAASNLIPPVPVNNPWGLRDDPGGQLPHSFLCNFTPDTVGGC